MAQCRGVACRRSRSYSRGVGLSNRKLEESRGEGGEGSACNEYVGFAVRPDSSIKSAREVIERLRQDPAAISIGLSTALGGSNHLATVVAMKAAGVAIRKSRIVVVKGAADSVQTRRFLDQEHAECRAILTELGLAK